MEAVFIIKNDNVSPQDIVSDCFVRILPPPGKGFVDYNLKSIELIFRNREHQTVWKKQIEISAGKIHPSIDWQKYPTVRVSLTNEEQTNSYLMDLPTEEQRAK